MTVSDAAWTDYLLLLAVGTVAGVLNVVAGGGSFLTLPILIFLGLPASVANGTNRVAIVLQSVGAVWGFHRYGVVTWRALLWAALPATGGGLVGTWAALTVPDAAFQKLLALLMVAITLWALWDPEGGRLVTSLPAPGRRELGLAGAFFLVGIYGGFVQAGVGFLILAATTFAGLDLVRGNAVKVLSVLLFTSVSLALFAWYGKVDWGMGLVLAAGTVAGGLIGVRLTVLQGRAGVRRAVTVVVVLFAVLLWLER